MNERGSTLRNHLLKFMVRVAKLRLLCKHLTLIEIKRYKKENRKEGCSLSLQRSQRSRQWKAIQAGSAGEESACPCQRRRRLGFSAWVGKTSGRSKQQLAPGFLPGKLQGQRSLVGSSPWGRKESDTSEHAHDRCGGCWSLYVRSSEEIPLCSCPRRAA